MDYREATRYLISLGNEVRASASDSVSVAKLGLDNITRLLSDLGNPQDAYPSVLIAGTNGKGSVAAMLDAILRSAGRQLNPYSAVIPRSPAKRNDEGSAVPHSFNSFRTGLYTSPHLVEIAERIQFDGRPIPQQEFADLFAFLRERIERLLASGTLRFHPTYFECLTAMAMEYFRRRNCSLAVFEVGMGGRLDATNTATPQVSVITEIDFDHERFLGHTITAIAGEKAGIIKPGGVVVTTASHPDAINVIREKAREQRARLIEARQQYTVENARSIGGCYAFEVRHSDGFCLPVTLSLRGKHQVGNSLAAIATARELAKLGFPIVDADIQQGLAKAIWPGRLELIAERPQVFLDGAHNPSGARALVEFWQQEFPSRRIILVYGAMRDKAVPEIAEILFPKAAAVILTKPYQFRSASPQAVLEFSGHLNRNITCEEEPQAALHTAIAAAAPDDVVFVTGSLFLVGDIKRRWPQAKAVGAAVEASPRSRPA
ncbi:MAG: bifunctional folylpolyglutamate synthase/dihydrofolate synthase [Acidobacteria bacterium]|nr:bifunctional folylpolyglutamate synthase/dihydrofolate synthase [Acidobacteriota bacterium]